MACCNRYYIKLNRMWQLGCEVPVKCYTLASFFGSVGRPRMPPSCCSIHSSSSLSLNPVVMRSLAGLTYGASQLIDQNDPEYK